MQSSTVLFRTGTLAQRKNQGATSRPMPAAERDALAAKMTPRQVEAAQARA